MKIEDYLIKDKDFDIFDECELVFAEPDDSKEAKENILWVINETKGMEDTDILNAIAVVVKSYYGHVIEWENF